MNILSDKEEKYTEGYWCTLDPYPNIDIFNKITAKFELNIELGFNLFESENVYSPNIVQELEVSNLPAWDEISVINNTCSLERSQYEDLTKICTPIKNKYVKGVVRTDSKKYLSGITESFRLNDEITCPANSYSGSVSTIYKVDHQITNSTDGTISRKGEFEIYIGLEYHNQK